MQAIKHNRGANIDGCICTLMKYLIPLFFICAWFPLKPMGHQWREKGHRAETHPMLQRNLTFRLNRLQHLNGEFVRKCLVCSCECVGAHIDGWDGWYRRVTTWTDGRQFLMTAATLLVIFKWPRSLLKWPNWCTCYTNSTRNVHYHHSRSRLQFSIGRHLMTADVDRSVTDLQSLSQSQYSQASSLPFPPKHYSDIRGFKINIY